MNVGDYVRTKDGKIFKWTKYCTTSKEDYNEHTRKLLFDENEIKSSPQIIDLIEVGDYVNGYKVIELGTYQDNEKYITIDFDMENDNLHWGQINEFTNKNIKSIVTHEQMEAMEYRVEE